MSNMKAMHTRSMFGNQAHSMRTSAPSYGFGSSTRSNQEKVFMSPEHAKLQSSTCSPGPSAYMLVQSVGSQPDGRKASAPMWVFGSNSRFDRDKGDQDNPGRRLGSKPRRCACLPHSCGVPEILHHSLSVSCICFRPLVLC